jgi:predicted RNA-binding protein YlqC (UPF0109 family)
MMKDLIDYVARSLVDDPTQVEVSERQHGNTTEVNLRVAKNDMGRVIGRNGKVANAMRTLLRVAAAHSDRRINLKVVEPE